MTLIPRCGMLFLSHKEIQSFPKNINNMVYISNALTIQNEQLTEFTPELINVCVRKYLEAE